MLVLERVWHNGHHYEGEGDGLEDGTHELLRSLSSDDDAELFDAILASLVRIADGSPPW